jgi:phosphoglycerol transferase MdoB-like AlkP superfamily enzyme
MHQEVNPSVVAQADEATAPAVAKRFWPARMVAYALGLMICLIPIRAWVVGWNWEWILHPRQDGPKVIASTAYDALFVAGFLIVMLLPMLLMRKRPRAQKAWFGAFVVLSIGIIGFCYANIDVVAMLGRPLNYQWLYYSGFLMSRDARDAMKASSGSNLILILLWLATMMVVLGEGFFRAARRIFTKAPRLRYVIVPLMVLLFVGYVAGSHWWLTTRLWPMQKLVNPVWALGRSLVESVDAPELYTMKTPMNADDVRALGERSPTTQATSTAPRNPAIKNVIVFVIESLPAEYVALYGAPQDATPNLMRLQSQSAIFDGIYAHAPATTKTMESLLCSIYPLISFRTITQERPDLPIPSIPSELKKAGYRSAFFSSNDLTFQNCGEFLKHRGFDYLEDFHNRGNGKPQFTSEWSYLHGTDEMSTVKSMLQWITGDQSKPFFIMSWTMMTHYPYYTTGPAIDFGVKEPKFNKYLNALHAEDAALGFFVDSLKEKGLLDSTLLVVMGDHGEAFGQHDQWGHGAWIYDENVRVPMILINPRLFHGERYKCVGGMVDLAPTIMDLLRLQSAPTWQGRSLFASDRSNRVYFFAPWSDLMFGMRDGDLKYIFNASHNSWEMFDLAKDPQELNSIAGAHHDDVANALYHMAAWVQYQKTFHDKLLAAGAH